MRNLRDAVMVMGGIAGVGFMTSAFVIGCSGDDTTTKDGGPDSTMDQTSPDTGGPDGDAGGVDMGMDDTGNPIQNFRTQIAQAFCQRFQTCCNSTDAGPFDYNTCVAGVIKGGVEGCNLDLQVPEILNGPNITLDNTAAQACLAGLATLSCPIVASNEWKPLADQCNNAVVGKVGVGGNCLRPIECQKDKYCNYLVDAGKSDSGATYGQCANLIAQNGLCGQNAPYYVANNIYSSEECGYKNWSNPRFCNYDTDPNKAGFKCDALRSNGTICYADNECTSGLCVDVTDAGTCGLGTCQCQQTSDFSRFCRDLKIKDAGPG